MTDIEIAKQVNLENILDIAKKTNIDENDVELYGKYKAKISNFEKYNKNSKGKLVLVTAMSPTPLGEGKTTISIAIADGLRKIGKKSILALREPSLGPVFGMKGGATGGGHAQVAPMEDINLHFTGDIHAITSANNLLSAMIDNHIYYGNKLQIEKVVWKRCVDLNDRQLRKIQTGLSGESKIVPREDGFDISVASEIMAIVCLSNDIFELREKQRQSGIEHISQLLLSGELKAFLDKDDNYQLYGNVKNITRELNNVGFKFADKNYAIKRDDFDRIFSNEVKEVVNEYNKAQEKETKETSNEIIYEETEEEVEY